MDNIRHSLSHVLAHAVLKLRPDTKIAIGPAIDNGFYYDFKFDKEFTPSDLKNVEKEMKKIIQSKLDFEKYELNINEAIDYYKKQNNPYKVELIEELKEKGEKTVSFYKLGDFVDLCKGPHVKNTSQIPIKGFKLDKIAGAYWRGDEKKDMLTRIYGLAFENEEELGNYINKREEALKRDHRKLGQELDLFSVHEEIGAGLICWHPKGAIIRMLIEDFWKKEHLKNGYDLIYTPHIGKSELWETSGHLGFYSDNMYAPMKIDDVNYFIKPMNCPFHIMIYKDKKRSYRELPVRYAELGTVYRYERSGVLHGLMRVRGFTQDDAHIICTHDQIENEILKTLNFSLDIWKVFGFKDIKAYIATQPKDCVGCKEDWEKATSSIINAIKNTNLNYEIDEGGGAFYGPKIDLKVKDAIDREWQMTTIQFDFNEAERFDLTYIDSDGEAKRPFMVHRALLGSLERFFGVLIEHYGGAFPLWLAPTQVLLIGVSEKHSNYLEEVKAKLKESEIRVEADIRAESVSKKIREARLQRIPYLVVIGDNEVENKNITVRNRNTQKQSTISLEEFIDLVKKEDVNKNLDLLI